MLAGIRAGRCWIAESADVRLSFTARTARHSAGIGERLRTGGDPVTLNVDVSGIPSGTVTLHTARGVVFRAEAGPIAWSTSAEEAAFVRVEIRHPTGRMAALTNPIFLV